MINGGPINGGPLNGGRVDVSSTPAPLQLIIDDRGNVLWFAAYPNFYIRL